MSNPRERVRQQIEVLRQAGVEWLGQAPPLPESALVNLFAGIEDEPPPIDDINDRRQALDLLSGAVSRCVLCSELVSTRTQTVFGVGPLNPEICFVGEAPGADEDRLGEPFVGAAGQMLNRILLACGIKRETVYICNILRCRPPGNRQPKPEECSNCRQHLERQLELVRPQSICCLGAIAASNLLQTKLTLGRLRGKFHDYRGIPVICTYHPASLLPGRNPQWKKEVWEDMKMLLTHLGKPIPKPTSAKADSPADDQSPDGA